MKYRTLPGIGTTVSNLALGTMGFGTETDEAQAFAVLDRFVDPNGNLVDTSNVYGAGASEELLGRWFASRPADVAECVVLATQARCGRALTPTRTVRPAATSTGRSLLPSSAWTGRPSTFISCTAGTRSPLSRR